MPEINIDNLKIHYELNGTGEKKLLILHGWGSSSAMWQKTCDILAERGMQTVVPDLPGFGQSQTPNTPWNLNDYCNFVEKFSKECPELSGEFYLAGHSFGGAISAKFCIRNSQKVKGLFLIAAACIRRKSMRKKILGGISKIVKVFYFLPYYSVARKLFYRHFIGGLDYVHAEGIMKETFFNVVDEDLSPFVAFIRVPTTIIWGSKDDTTFIDEAYYINKKIKSSKLEVIPGANHGIEIAAAEPLAQKILENIK